MREGRKGDSAANITIGSTNEDQDDELSALRERRLKKLKAQRLKRRSPFGDVVEIRKIDFMQEVTEASKKSEVALMVLEEEVEDEDEEREEFAHQTVKE